MFNYQTADNLLIEATKKLLYLQQQERWTVELPKRCPPILWFGNAQSSKPLVLTLGANPSRQEYLQDSAEQALAKVQRTNDHSLLTYLEPPHNRFRLLRKGESLDCLLADRNLRMDVIRGYDSYFYSTSNPYSDKWFGCNKEDSYRVEGFLHGLGASYYDVPQYSYQAIHIDLFPFATLSDFNELAQQAEDDLFRTGWAKNVVMSLIDVLKPHAIVAFGRSNVNHFAMHIDPSVSRLPWIQYHDPVASYRVGWSEILGTTLIGLSVNLGNPKGFNSDDLHNFGSHIGTETLNRNAPTKKRNDDRETHGRVTTYSHTRLCFKADVIEPLAMDDKFCIVTPNGNYEMTKCEFYKAFQNVTESESYQQKRIYHYPKLPRKALQFRK